MDLALSAQEIKNRIYSIRGHQVMLDSDLAQLYGVETSALKRAVKRNIERFPEDFMFEITESELKFLRCQIGMSKVDNYSSDKTKTLRFQVGTSKLDNFPGEIENRGGSRFLPYAFCEPGVAMVSTILRSTQAIQINISIMRTFIELRKRAKNPIDWSTKFSSFEKRLDQLESKDRERSDKIRQENNAKNQSTLVEYYYRRNFSINSEMKIERVQHVVAKHWRLSVSDLRANSRAKLIVVPRQIAMYLVRTLFDIPLNEIGLYFGDRDHTTVLHACRKVETQTQKDPFLQSEIESLRKLCG